MEKKLTGNESWFYTLLKSIGDAVIIADTEGLVTFLNPVAEKLTGWRREDAAGKNLDEVFSLENGDTGEKIQSPAWRVLEKGLVSGLPSHALLVNMNGTRIPIEDSIASIKDDEGTVSGVVLVFHDTTEQRKLETLLLKAKKEWEETFDTINDAITIHDRDFNIIRANRAASEMLGLPFKDLLSRKCFESYHGTDSPPERCPSCNVLKTGTPSTTEIYEPKLNRHIEIKALPRFDKNNALIGLVHIVRDVTERKHMENELMALSLTDELTGLYNRRGFLTLARQQLRIANRLRKGVLLIYADLDGLKTINDAFGHHEGDRALLGVADLLKTVFRESDIIARIGGDEFAIFPLEVSDESIRTINTRLQSHLSELNEKRRAEYKLNITTGMVYYRKDCPHTIDELLDKADRLMYEEKKKKR